MAEIDHNISPETLSFFLRDYMKIRPKIIKQMMNDYGKDVRVTEYAVIKKYVEMLENHRLTKTGKRTLKE